MAKSYRSLFSLMAFIGFLTSSILFCTHSNASELNVKLSRLYTDSDTGYHKSGNSYLNINFCFESIFVNERNFGRNCIRIKSQRNSKNQQEHTIIFDAPRMSVDFKTVEGNRFELEYSSSDDTSNFLSFLKQFSESQRAIFGAMCKQLSDTPWQTKIQKKEIKNNKRLEENLVRQFDLSRRYDNIQSISYRCYVSVERLTQKIFVEDDTDGIFFDGIDEKR